VRPGTEVFFHNMKGPWPHWLDQDIRILRLHFLPNYVFGKVAMCNRVPFGSISLRDCIAKGEGFIIMWRPSSCALPSKTASQNERLAPRERSLEETRSVYVSALPLSQLWAEDFDPCQWIIIMFWAAGESSTGDVPLPPRRIPVPPPAPQPAQI